MLCPVSAPQVAAKKLNLGLTVLKRVCREIGLVRWPYRKRKSIENVISQTHDFLVRKSTSKVTNTFCATPCVIQWPPPDALPTAHKAGVPQASSVPLKSRD